MEIQFSPEIESKLTDSANRQGRQPSDLANDILARHFDYEAWLDDAVREGEAQLDRGEYVSHAEVRTRLHRFLSAE